MPADEALAAALALYDAARAECDAAHEILMAVLHRDPEEDRGAEVDRFLRIGEAADLIGLRRTTCFNKAETGELPTVEIPNVGRRVRLSDLQEYIAGLPQSAKTKADAAKARLRSAG